MMNDEAENRFECPLPNPDGKRSTDAMRLVKALPVFVVLGAQTVALIAFAVNLSFTQTQQGKDIAEIKASVANVQASVNANIGPSAVNSAKILQLENQVAQLFTRFDSVRDDLARLRSKQN